MYKGAVHTDSFYNHNVAVPIKEQKQNKKASVPKRRNENSDRGKKSKDKRKATIFLDGDNHINEAVKGIEHTSKDVAVIAIFSQSGAKRKFDEKFGERRNVSSKIVSPGNQAVDNQIKAEAGQLLKEGRQKILIVSRDKGFERYANKKKNKKSNNKIFTAKSVQEGMKKKL